MNQTEVRHPTLVADTIRRAADDGGGSATTPAAVVDAVDVSCLGTAEQRQIRSVQRHLLDEFTPSLDPVVIDTVLADVLAPLVRDARFTAFVPVLADRIAHDRLRALTERSATALAR